MTIVMLVSQVPPELVTKLITSGAIDYISVPIDELRLQMVLENALARRKDQQRLSALAVENTSQTTSSSGEHRLGTDALHMSPQQIMFVEKMATIGQLTAGVAHEINNPVGFVASNLNTLQYYQKRLRALGVQYRRLLEEISFESVEKDGQTKRSALVQRVRKIERLQTVFDPDFLYQDSKALIRESLTGVSQVKTIVRDLKMVVHPGQDHLKFVDLHKHLDATLNVVWHQLKQHITVQKSYAELPLVKCWDSQINQVFLNIIVNAIHAIVSKGTILIKTEVVDAKWVQITISDTGKGISDENIDKIFKPSFTTKPAGKGTGLGLHISRNIIKNHSGTILVESQLGHGTSFRIRLPISSDTTDTPKQA